MTECKFCGSYSIEVVPPEDLPVAGEGPRVMENWVYYECHGCGRGWLAPIERERVPIQVRIPRLIPPACKLQKPLVCNLRKKEQ